jgi:DNA-binding CsgD family transcriptional regulator
VFVDRRDVAFSLVHDLLAAPGSQQGWRDFFLHLCDALEGSGSNFIAHDFTSREGSVTLTARTAPDAIALYQAYWHQFDPWAHAPAVAGMHAGTIVIGDQLLTRGDMQRTPFYSEFGRQYDVFQCMMGLIEASPEALSGISVNRSERQRSFDAEDSSLFALLMPLLKRALQIHRRLTGAELMAANAMDVLDRLPHGVVLVSASGAVLSTNRAADEILRTRDGLTSERGELRASTVALTHKLRAALEAAVRTSQGLAIDGSTALALPRPSGRRPLSVVIAPLPVRRAVLTSNPAAAAVFVTDPERPPVPDVAMIRALFALTESEAELVRWLLSGFDLGQAAARLGLRLDTVRKRLKVIFEKTNTHRQADLVRLVLSTMAGL